jgi:23S rRNA (adenine2503-C2)-methyltransferase
VPMAPEKRDVLEATPDELGAWLEAEGQPAWRLGRLLDWLYGKRADSFDAMTDLPAALRERLDAGFAMPALRVVDRSASQDGATVKFLFELADGERIESVWMGGEDRATFCVSSQAGCALGCRFCATGAMGLARNLRTGEILGQVMMLAREKGWPANIVFMGMGEPLLNLEAVLPALEALTDERRFALGARRVTVSTAGITPGIRRLAESPVRPNLALSLNSPDDAKRRDLMPVTRRYPLDEVLEACGEYAEKTGRRLLIEYVLLDGVNTSLEDAWGVIGIARRLKAMVNLIPFNPVEGCEFRPPERGLVRKFRNLLEEQGVTAAQRYRRGRDIAAGCGQLRGAHAAGREGRTTEKQGRGR